MVYVPAQKESGASWHVVSPHAHQPVTHPPLAQTDSTIGNEAQVIYTYYIRRRSSTTQMDSSGMPVETKGDESNGHKLYREILSDLQRIIKSWEKRQQPKTDNPVYKQILTIDEEPVTLCIYGSGHEPAMKLEGSEKQYIFVAFVKNNAKFIATNVESTAELIRHKLITDGSFLEDNFNASMKNSSCISLKIKTSIRPGMG